MYCLLTNPIQLKRVFTLDGIYVFLRNLSDSNDAAVPPNLKHLVINDNDIESLKFCKWSLSGPASKSQEKGSVQQRYSYPRGRPEYSNTKGVRHYHRCCYRHFQSCSLSLTNFRRVYINRDQCGQ